MTLLTVSIDKLEGFSNYDTWLVAIKGAAMLNDGDQLDHMTGETTAPTEETAFKEWKTLDRKVVGLIVTNLAPTALKGLSRWGWDHNMTAKDTMDFLERTCKPGWR
ncbi:hypothetical protein CDD80_1887 [Ophiocordyceps camponoti-rufipedis]|uniref:Retrotransposon Copia-like N-terminal domain-containing protein n=1 Tax=Ophiocordyceps camponoti-rufipedis TaxID=2004952 RepID=A0A2C5Z8K0_9HYPO|nr:hypothetical protein CDD80_1887 [Ophiocordyceps camponoti-rufipedis]